MRYVHEIFVINKPDFDVVSRVNAIRLKNPWKTAFRFLKSDTMYCSLYAFDRQRKYFDLALHINESVHTYVPFSITQNCCLQVIYFPQVILYNSRHTYSRELILDANIFIDMFIFVEYSVQSKLISSIS